MKPGYIVIYRERGSTLRQDRKLRATYRGHVNGLAVYASRDGEYVEIAWNDVIRVEPTQHGWCGVPATSGAR